jgi:hypothetical protein
MQAPGHVPQRVSCSSPDACTAAGTIGDGRIVAEVWNGTRWGVQSMPLPVGVGSALVHVVSCVLADTLFIDGCRARGGWLGLQGKLM